MIFQRNVWWNNYLWLVYDYYKSLFFRPTIQIIAGLLKCPINSDIVITTNNESVNKIKTCQTTADFQAPVTINMNSTFVGTIEKRMMFLIKTHIF